VPLRIIRAIQIPVIIAGITLSTMHQSTLGTMMVILPSKVHPLWYSPLLPLYFYLSAIAAGLGMTVFEAYHSARTYGYPFELKLLSSLTKIIPWVLGIYLVLKIGELFVTREWTYLLEGGFPALMWVIEVVGGFLIPFIYFFDKKTRSHVYGLVWGSYFIMGGLILNRMNTALIMLKGSFYYPSWQEIAVSVGLTALGVIMFDLAVRFLPIFPEPKDTVAMEKSFEQNPRFAAQA
jgi:Ni/Fe-hydrogenase subunit HybB-like protein